MRRAVLSHQHGNTHADPLLRPRLELDGRTHRAARGRRGFRGPSPRARSFQACTPFMTVCSRAPPCSAPVRSSPASVMTFARDCALEARRPSVRNRWNA
jgi:hypothetical protein